MERLIAQFADVKAIDEVPGAFEGYGAVFGNIDAYGDTITRGAFKESLRDWKQLKRLPPMLLQHGGGWMGAAEDLVPIGKWTEMREDETGLYVKGRLIAMETDIGKRVHAAMREGVLDGLSIGFRTKEFSLGTKPDEPARTLKKIDLVEVSVVTFPANGAARVGDVKQLSEWTVREFEQFLREAGGFSREAAKHIISKGFTTSLRDAVTAERQEIANGLRALSALIKESTAHGTRDQDPARRPAV